MNLAYPRPGSFVERIHHGLRDAAEKSIHGLAARTWTPEGSCPFQNTVHIASTSTQLCRATCAKGSNEIEGLGLSAINLDSCYDWALKEFVAGRRRINGMERV